MASSSTPISQIRRGGGGGNTGSFPDMGPVIGNPMQADQPPLMMPQLMMPPMMPTMGDNPLDMGGMGNTGVPSENQLVEDILREMNGNAGDSNINGGSYKYATDQSQVPIGPPPTSDRLTPQMTDQMIEDEYRNLVRSENRLISRLVDTQQHPWSIAVVNGILVFLTLLFVSLPQINKLLFTLLPGLLLESGQVSFQGVILKCIIGLIIYIVITTILL